jgi:hypothetical protein
MGVGRFRRCDSTPRPVVKNEGNLEVNAGIPTAQPNHPFQADRDPRERGPRPLNSSR